MQPAHRYVCFLYFEDQQRALQGDLTKDRLDLADLNRKLNSFSFANRADFVLGFRVGPLSAKGGEVFI